jgi:endonuclease/exonuclease/phosphatase family metal-dependent hydrolase
MGHKLGILLLVLVALPACGGSAAKTPTAQADAATGQDTASVQDTQATDSQGDAAVDVPGKATFETADPKAVTVLNYNVMCSFCNNSMHPEWEQAWSVRLPMTQDVIHRHDPDLLAIQELQELVPTDPTLTQAEQIVAPENLYDFEYYHHQPGDLFDADYDDATVYWKKARFTKLATGVFWLSPTPDASYTTGFAKAQEPRLVVWVLLHDKVNDRDFYFVNTHFDNNAPSQEKSAPLVLDRLSKLAGVHPMIFAGDFNTDPTDKAWTILTQGDDGKGFAFQDSKALAQTAAVFSNVTPVPIPFAQLEDIDHVFLAGATFQVAWWLTDLWRYGPLQQAPSDHNGAVVTTVLWK